MLPNYIFGCLIRLSDNTDWLIIWLKLTIIPKKSSQKTFIVKSKSTLWLDFKGFYDFRNKSAQCHGQGHGGSPKGQGYKQSYCKPYYSESPWNCILLPKFYKILTSESDFLVTFWPRIIFFNEIIKVREMRF